MLKKLIGYILAVAGFTGVAFFKNYKGSIIPYSALWLFLSIIVGIVGIFLINSTKSNKHSKQEKYNKKRLDTLRQNGEKILLTVDNCEIRENSYNEEIISESYSKVQQIDAIYDPNRNYRQNFIEQSAIIYYYKIGDKKIRMTSQSFPFNSSILKNHVENKKIILYVNRFDKNDYMFELIA